MASHIRKYILLTLSHAESAERWHYTPHFVSSKCRSILNCQSVIVAKEYHKAEGYHYHVGILNDTASSHTVTKLFRKAFPEFEGMQLNVSFHKSWNTICAYILKQDKDPFCWGTSKEQCRERYYRKKTGKPTLDFMTRLKNCNSWREVAEDDFLGPRVARSYSSVKQLFLDLKSFKEEDSLESRIEQFLESKKDHSTPISPYTNADLGTKGQALSWLGENLSTNRPHRTPQLLLVGEPGSGKTSFVTLLSEFCKVYEVPMRKDDFSSASTQVDLWFIDELSNKRMSPEILNKVLDGSKVSLDAKYGYVFDKDKNVPVIMACNAPPEFESINYTRAFITRVKRVDFDSVGPQVKLSSERLAKSLLLLLQNRKAQRLEEQSVLIEKALVE